MRTFVYLVMKYREIPGVIVRLIRGVDQRFIKVEYDKDFFDGLFIGGGFESRPVGISQQEAYYLDSSSSLSRSFLERLSIPLFPILSSRRSSSVCLLARSSLYWSSMSK